MNDHSFESLGRALGCQTDAAALVRVIRAVSPRLERPIAYRHQLRLGQAMAVAAALLPAFSAFSGRGGLLPRTAQVWAAPTMGSGAPAVLEAHRSAVSFGSSGAAVPLDSVSRVVCVLFAAGLLVVLARLAKDVAATLRIIADAQAIRRHGSSAILASELIDVPFSFWLPGRYYIVVPSGLVLRSLDLRMAIGHEAQHHRHQDTKWVYWDQLLAAMFFINPAVHYLAGQLRELQEFACDEALGGQRRITASDYCQCLLRVAEEATRHRHSRIHASMISGGAGMVLGRRIEALSIEERDGGARMSATSSDVVASLTEDVLRARPATLTSAEPHRCAGIDVLNMLVILGLVPFIVESKPAALWIFAWYSLLLVSSVALGWVVSRVYSEPLNRALRSRRPGAFGHRAVQAP